MRDEGVNKFESAPEHIPTREEVFLIMRELIGKEFKIEEELSDEQGLYLLVARVQGETEGDIIEYSYMRKGIRTQNSSAVTEIYVAIFDNGTPVTGGGSAARYSDGQWTIFKFKK